MYVKPDTSWFDENPDAWLSRDDFVAYQRVSGVDFRDLLSEDVSRVRRAQESLAAQSRICSEIRRNQAGFVPPLLFYTHDLRLAREVPHPNPELERLNFASDMGDSLRRRHIALSHAILPRAIASVQARFAAPIVIENLGAGVGLDTLNAVRKAGAATGAVLNYEIDPDAVRLGTAMAAWLEARGELSPGQVQYRLQSFASSREKAHVVVLIGVICGMTDDAARDKVLRFVHRHLEDCGAVVVSSSNVHIRDADPLQSFLIQHIGTCDDPRGGWGLNCRTRESMYGILSDAGFKDIQLYDDTHYPGREALSDAVLLGVDPLPFEALGCSPVETPLSLPAKETLERRTGYHWIAVAAK